MGDGLLHIYRMEFDIGKLEYGRGLLQAEYGVRVVTEVQTCALRSRPRKPNSNGKQQAEDGKRETPVVQRKP